jgi:hypothetical protein
MADIKVDTPDGDHRSFFYHFEGDKTGRIVSFSSTARNIALAVRIAKTFGGKVDFADCDSTSVDFRAPEFKFNNATDGVPWRKLQERVAAVEPITPADVEKFFGRGAYDER